MKTKLLFTFLVLSTFAKAQSFTPDVIGSAGTFATSVSGSMSWTIGEVMTETYSSANNFFTQGFHQPDTSFVISVIDNSQQNISIYPNPVVDNLIIDLSRMPGNHSLYIYDMLGQLLYSMANGTSTINHQPLTIDFSSYANGIYLLDIVNSESNTRNSYKINKAE